VRRRFALNVSVFVLVRQAESVLLLRRANTGWKDGFYSLPAGVHDGAEPLSAAASRELREETGLTASADKLRLAHVLHCASSESGTEWLGAFFEADEWTGTPRLAEPDKHDHLGCFAVNDLPPNIIPYTRQGIEASIRGVPFSTYGWADDR